MHSNSQRRHRHSAVMHRIAGLERALEQAQHLLHQDDLPPLLNRRGFRRACDRWAGNGPMAMLACCVMIDLDGFKAINDRYGHLVGDQAIQHVAQVMANAVRPSDIVCRYGGEEFCLLLPGVSVEQVAELAERIRSRIETQCGPGVIPGENVRITSSFGVAAMSSGGSTLAELIKQADQALYAAKAAGRNRVSRYDADIRGQHAPRVAA